MFVKSHFSILYFFFYHYWNTSSNHIFQRLKGVKLNHCLSKFSLFLSFHRNIMCSSISILVQNIIQHKFDNNISMCYWNQYCYQKFWFNIMLSLFQKNLDLNFDYLCVFPMWIHLGFFCLSSGFWNFMTVYLTLSFYSHPIWLLVSLSVWRLLFFFKSESLLSLFYCCISFSFKFSILF